MVKHFMTNEEMQKHKLLTASATIAAMALPLSFATPSHAIEHADLDAQTHILRKKSAQVPSVDSFNNTKKMFEDQLVTYKEAERNYNSAIKDNLPLPNYDAMVIEQDAKVAKLNEEIEPLMAQLTALNENISQINTQNTKELADLLDAYNAQAQAAQTAHSNLLDLQHQIEVKTAEDELRISDLKAKASKAIEIMQSREKEFESFKIPYEQQASVYEAQKAQYDTKLSSLNSEIESLQAKIDQLPQEGSKGYVSARVNVLSLQKQVKNLQSEYDEIYAEYNLVNESYAELDARYKALETSYNEAISSVDAANNAVEEANVAIAQETANLKKLCSDAEVTYNNAEEARKKIEIAYNKQYVDALLENEQNAAFYANLESKITKLNAMVDEFNAKRFELQDQAQVAKAAIDGAFTTAKQAYENALRLKDSAEDLGKQYNIAAEAYNKEVQKEYQAKLDAYNEAQAKFQEELKEMEKANSQFGNLTKPAWQGLSFGRGAEKQLDAGGIVWVSDDGSDIAEGNKIFHELAPQQTASVRYAGKAVEGFTFDGKQIGAMIVSYTNLNLDHPNGIVDAEGPVYIGADADFRNGFTACYKIVDPDLQTPMAPGSQFSLISPSPSSRHFWNKIDVNGKVEYTIANMQGIGVSISFYDAQGKRIEFSKEVPAGLYMPNLYRQSAANGGIDYFKSITWSDFDEIIPIKGASIETDQIIKGYAQPLKTFVDATNKIIVNSEYTPNFDANGSTWEDINNPDFYKSCIFGLKNTDSTIKFTITKFIIPTADTQEVKDYPLASDLGFSQRFLANIPAIPLPMVPTIKKPTPPTPVEKVDLTFVDLGAAPAIQDVQVPVVAQIAKPATLPGLGEITPKNVTPQNGLQEPSCPVAPISFETMAQITKPAPRHMKAPVAPLKLPEVPAVPAPPNKRADIPETSDSASLGMTGLAFAMGSALLARKAMTKNNRSDSK